MQKIMERLKIDETDDEDTVVKKFQDWLETMSSSERNEVSSIIQAFVNHPRLKPWACERLNKTKQLD